MRALHRDEKGDIPGLPLEIAVIALVMAVVIPTVWSISGHYREEQFEELLRDELSRFKRAAGEVHSSDPGNIRAVSIDLPREALSKIDYVRCGGDMPQLIRYRFAGNNEMTFHLGGPVVSNLTADGYTSLDLPVDGSVMLLRRSRHVPDTVELMIKR